MSVTNYIPKSDIGCKYSYDKLDNVVYLVSQSHVKDIHIDNGEAYIDGLTEVPIRLNGFNIEFNEESSLDERYSFSKSVRFSMHGYVTHQSFSDKYYVILKSKDGTLWMVNVDFPSKVTYTFNLSKDMYETNFTFASLSNFPTLRLATEIDDTQYECVDLRLGGIKSLQLLEKDSCSLDTVNSVVYTYGASFKDVEYLGDSCSLAESFDGENVTTTISFDIAFDAYKSSWHYNLVEFLQNLYSSIIVPKGGDNTFFSGFNFGLQPSFRVVTNTDKGESDIITVTLVESSSQGSTSAVEWTPEEDTRRSWVYIKDVDGIMGYECVSFGEARYLLQEEINHNGVPTGRYKALEGYAEYYEALGLNIVGTFSEDNRFSNPECSGATCIVNTDIPTMLTYYSATCYSYTYSSTCDWNVSGLTDYMTVTPMSGVGNSSYTLSVCNTKTPTANESSTFTITSGDNVKIVNVNLVKDTSILNPQVANINCLPQNVYFTYDSTCPITVTSIDSRLTYQITNSQLIVNVPMNYSIGNAKTWDITVKDCHQTSGTAQIVQDKTYENWVDSSDYVCESGNSYVKQYRYTGTTPTNINTMTGEFRSGSLIQSGDTRCGTIYTRWIFNGNYECVNGNKFEVEEEQISSDGINWTPTGATRLGQMVEESSEWCIQPVEYKWVLTTDFECVDIKHDYTQDYLTFVTRENGTFKFTAQNSGDSIDYSLDDGVTWVELASDTNSPTVASGNKIMWKATLTPVLDKGIGTFSSTGQFDVEGNVMSLLYDDDFSGETSLSGKNDAFYGLFSGNTNVVSAENMSLPATTLAGWCYRAMFSGCTSLTTAPQLLATTLASNCYTEMFRGCTSLVSPPKVLPAKILDNDCYCGMFQDCTSLTKAPELQATTLSFQCCLRMFKGCTSLTTAPELPATELGGSCYLEMFRGCTALTMAPELPATELYLQCYGGMFQDCTSLTKAPTVLPATTLYQGSYLEMFKGCTSLTTAPTMSATTVGYYSCSQMFSGCTSLTIAPELQATTLDRDCYNYMFANCTSLTTAPILSAATLAEGCYSHMFYGCNQLNYIKCLATDISATYSTSYWLYGVSSSGTFVKDASMNDWTSGVDGIPNGWTVQNA